MTTIDLDLSDEMRAFIESRVAQEGHASPSEYLRSLVRAEQDRSARHALDEKLREGLASGPAAPMTHDDWLALRREARESLAGEAIRP